MEKIDEDEMENTDQSKQTSVDVMNRRGASVIGNQNGFDLDSIKEEAKQLDAAQPASMV